MEYLSADHPNLTLKITCTVERDLVHPPSPEQIVDGVLDQSRHITRKTHTSRAMWPEEELVGVGFERDEPYLAGQIMPRKVTLKFEGLDGFDSAYETVADWCNEASFDLPPQDEFLVGTVVLNLETEGESLTLDTAKCGPRTFLDGIQYGANGIEGKYDSYSGWVSLFLDGDRKAPLEDVRAHLDAFLSEDYVVIVPTAELEVEYDPSSGEFGQNYSRE